MRINLNKISKILLILLVIASFFIAGGIFLWPNQPDTHEFAGNINDIEDNTIFATGFFLENGKPIHGKEDQKSSIEILIDSNTELTRLAIKIPQGVTSFNTNDLEKEESLTDLVTITNDSNEHIIGIEAVLMNNGADNKFIGRKLYFRVPVFGQ